MQRFIWMLAVTFVGLGVFGSSIGHTQGQAPPPQQQAPQVDVDDEQVQAVARAYVKIQDLRQDYMQQHGNPQEMDSDEAQQVQQQFRQETQEVIEDEGLDPQTFSQVVQAAQMNPELRDDLFTAIEDEGGQVPQAPQQGRQQRQQQAPQVDVSDEQVQAVASVYVDIQSLREEYEQQHGNLQELEADEAQQLQQQFQQETQQLIQDEGLNPQLFGQVMQAIRTDADLRSRFFSAVEAAGGEVPSGPQSQQ